MMTSRESQASDFNDIIIWKLLSVTLTPFYQGEINKIHALIEHLW